MPLAPAKPSFNTSIRKTLLDPLKNIFSRPATPSVAPTMGPVKATPIPGRVPGEQGFEITGGGRTPTPTPPASTAPIKAPIPGSPGFIGPVRPPVPNTGNSSSMFSPSAVPQVKAPPVYGVPTEAPLAPFNPPSGIKPPETPQDAPGATSSAGTTPAVPPELEKAYEASLRLTPEELATEEDLDKLYESTKLGMDKLEGQGRGIPLELVRGFQEKLFNQGQIQAQTLETRLARMQAKRQAALEASKFALERADKKVEAEKSLSKPFEVGAGTSVVKLNPATGKYETVFSSPDKTKAESFTLGEGQIRYDEKGNIIAQGPEKTTPVKQSIVKVNGVDYMVDEQGNLTKPPVPTDPAAGNLKKEAKGLVDDLLNTKAYKAMGGWSTRLGGQWGTAYGDAQAKAAQLTAILAKENLGLLKGPMSDKDLQFIKSMSSGFEGAGIQSESYIKERLESIQKKLAGELEVSGGQIIEYQGKRYQTDADGNFDPNSPLTNVGSDTNTAPDLDKAMQSIGQFESGGNYRAIGKPTKKGDRAYGKYQIMASNIPSWTKEALGTSLTVQQFLNNPQLQDAVARYKMAQILKDHGTLENLASVWFSGQPAHLAGNAKDVNNTSVPQYIAKVRSIYKQLG